MAAKNSPMLWDAVWSSSTNEVIKEIWLKEERSIKWSRIKDVVERELSGFSNIRTVEIGGGTGTYSALMAREGATPTIIDYSEVALEKCRSIFEVESIPAEYLLQDALNIAEDLVGKFDISMSFGTAEHFKEAQRQKIISSHFELVRPGGLVIISVPNSWNIPYRVMKWKLERQGRWAVGEEYPFSRFELRSISKRLGFKNVRFIGDSLFSSFAMLGFMSPKNIARRFFGAKPSKRTPIQTGGDLEKGSFLDEYLSYSLVLIARKAG